MDDPSDQLAATATTRLAAFWKSAIRWKATANYGDFPYPLHNFTYHLQDLTFLRYFGGR